MRWKGGFISNVYRSNTGHINLTTLKTKTHKLLLKGIKS